MAKMKTKGKAKSKAKPKAKSGKKLKKAIDKEVLNANLLVIKQDKRLHKKNLVFPERYLTKHTAHFQFAVNITTATTGYTFIIPALSNTTPAGINAANGGGGVDSLTYQLVHAGSVLNSNYLAVGSGGNSTVQSAINTRGSAALGGIYDNQTVYASKIKVNLLPTSQGDAVRVCVAPIAYYVGAANTYNTDAYTSLRRMEDGQYAKSKYFICNGVNKPLVNFVEHNKIAGVSKDVFLNEDAYKVSSSSNQPSSFNTQRAYTCWMVWIASADGLNFGSGLSFDIDLELYTAWQDQNEQTLA